MPLTPVLAEFNACIVQCENLIASAHRTDASGVALFTALDREQITISAFLNMVIGWEKFLEASLAVLMTGGTTLGGAAPVRYVSPPTEDAARDLIIGVMRIF